MFFYFNFFIIKSDISCLGVVINFAPSFRSSLIPELFLLSRSFGNTIHFFSLFSCISCSILLPLLVDASITKTASAIPLIILFLLESLTYVFLHFLHILLLRNHYCLRFHHITINFVLGIYHVKPPPSTAIVFPCSLHCTQMCRSIYS